MDGLSVVVKKARVNECADSFHHPAWPAIGTLTREVTCAVESTLPIDLSRAEELDADDARLRQAATEQPLVGGNLFKHPLPNLIGGLSRGHAGRDDDFGGRFNGSGPAESQATSSNVDRQVG